MAKGYFKVLKALTCFARGRAENCTPQISKDNATRQEPGLVEKGTVEEVGSGEVLADFMDDLRFTREACYLTVLFYIFLGI